MIPATSTISALRRIPVTSLQEFSPLFKAYCTGSPALEDYYAGHWHSAADRVAAADRAAAHRRDRDTLVDVLLAQNDRWGLDEATRANIEALADDESVAVVTGQQTALLGGPLYTPAKIITTLQVARQLAQETGRTVVPVFWLEGEDHDLEEVASVHVLRRNKPVELRYAGHRLPARGSLGAVGRLPLNAQVRSVIQRLDDALPASDFKPDVMELVRSCYQEGALLEDAFARMIKALFPETGLVLINPDDVRLKALTAPLFERELREPTISSEHVNRAGEALRQTYHQQVRARPTNLFLLEDNSRLSIDMEPGGFRLRGTDRHFSMEELLSLLEKHPEQFSPNVVLRPLMQDALLPTAVYVGGPSEIAYFGQYGAVYEWAGIPMPIIYPRASFSLIESKVQKVLDKYDLELAHFEGPLEQLFQKVVLAEMAVDVEALFQEAMRPIHESVNTLKESAGTVDPTLVSSVEATRAALIKEMNALKDRVVRAEKRNHDEIRDQLAKAHTNLFPLGAPQERVVSVLYFLNKYGLRLLTELQEVLTLDTSEHHVVVL